MTTEEKTLALVNAEQEKRGFLQVKSLGDSSMRAALIAAIEAHEADKKAFSDAMRIVQEHLSGPKKTCLSITIADGRKVQFADFILPEPEPDPLVEIAREMTLLDGVVRTDNQKAAVREGRAGNTASDDFYDRLRMALSARGYKIERIDNA